MTAQYNIQYVNTGNVANDGQGTSLREAFIMINDNFAQLFTPVPYADLGNAVSGARAFVNDGNLVASGNFGSQVSGGGANIVPVWSDGTHWYVG